MALDPSISIIRGLQASVLLNASLPLIGPILGILTGSVSITLVGYEFDR